MSDATPKSNKAALWAVFFVIMIDLLGFGIVLPLLPRYADKLLPGANIPDGAAHGIVIGLLMAIFSMMQFIFAPIWGRVSDRIGRRPILILGLVGSVIFYALFGYASTLSHETSAVLALTLMFISRIGSGIAGATISTAQAVIADSTPKEKRAHGMAIIGAAFGIGFTFGPIIAGLSLLLAPDSPEIPGYAAATLSLFALIFCLLKMPETRVQTSPQAKRHWLDIKGMFTTLQTPTVGILVAIFFLATFGFAKFETTLSLLTKDFHYSDRDNFWIFAYVGFVLMFTQGYFYRKLVKKWDEIKLMRLGVAFMFLGLAGLSAVTIATNSPMRITGFFISLALGVIGFAFLTPSANALISKRSDPNRQGEILGVNQSFSALARIFGPIIGLFLFKLNDKHILPYISSAILLAIVLALLPKIKASPATNS